MSYNLVKRLESKQQGLEETTVKYPTSSTEYLLLMRYIHKKIRNSEKPEALEATVLTAFKFLEETYKKH